MAISIDKAIEVLKRLKEGGEATIQEDIADACQAYILGIEALKREKEYRLTRGNRTFDLLPGETEE